MAALNGAISAILSESSSWRKALSDAIADISDERRDTLQDVENLLSRTIAAAGEEFRCNVDFLGSRVVEELQRIKAGLMGTEYQPTPTFCDFTPDLLDLNLNDPSLRNRVELSGYNFDSEPGLDVYAVDGATKIDITARLTMQTHYHMTLDLSRGDDFQLSDVVDMISFSWNGVQKAQVPVLPQEPNPCEVLGDSIGLVTGYFQPPHTNGDKEFFGNVDINVTVRLLRSDDGSHIDAEIEMTAIQPNDDHTTAAGTSLPFRLFTAPPGTRILSVAAPEVDVMTPFHDVTWEVETIAGGGGLVKEYVIRGDRSGEDAGVYTDVTVHFNQFEVQLIETGECEAQ